MAKRATDPAMSWLDPDSVPTLGDWFRAGGYETHYRGKWHISHADLLIPGTHESLMSSDSDGALIRENLDVYRKADRLDPFGFSGWVGREPHGAARADCGAVRDGVFAEQVIELFGELAAARRDGPWLAVASFVNPHDIAFSGFGWEQILQLPPPDDSVPDIPEAPSQSDSFAGRPPCQEAWKALWPEMLYEQAADLAYRRLYYYLHKLVDGAIGRILESLESSGMADDTLVVFTSDHGDLLGAHGGLMQKWYNAFDEAIRVPLIVKGPGVARTDAGVTVPTSHVDLVPTLLGLAGIDIERAMAGAAVHHGETRTLPGRDLSSVITGTVTPETVAAPVYFMTEDDVARGSSARQPLHRGAVRDRCGARPMWSRSSRPCRPPTAGHRSSGSSTTTTSGSMSGTPSTACPPNPFATPPAESLYELHNLSRDPEERQNLAAGSPDALAQMQSVLSAQREEKRLLPAHHNPAA